MKSPKDHLVREIDCDLTDLLPEVLDTAKILALSDSALKKDWLKSEENEAWQHL